MVFEESFLKYGGTFLFLLSIYRGFYMSDNVEQKIIKIVAETLKIDENSISRDSKFVDDLGISEDMVKSNLILTTNKGEKTKLGSTVLNSVNPDSIKEVFGVVPPDLTLTARSRGSEWIYTFLTSFYEDDTRPMGVNNILYPNVNMPHVLWYKEGLKTLNDNNMLSVKIKGELTQKQYEQEITDLVNFLTYVSEPAQLERYSIGLWVMIFLVFFVFITYLLKIEYWRDVK